MGREYRFFDPNFAGIESSSVSAQESNSHVVHNTAPVLHASRGPISLRSGKTNVILATGAIPTTTILLNSISDKLEGRAGKRLTAHFRS